LIQKKKSIYKECI